MELAASSIRMMRMQQKPVELLAFGDRLAEFRRFYGADIGLPNLTAIEFARIIGIPASLYLAYEEGDADPTLHFLLALRQSTGVSLDWLLADGI
jgi:transcriptional regulator with XRE-family HTH domain